MLLKCEIIWFCEIYLVFPEMPFLNKQQISVKKTPLGVVCRPAALWSTSLSLISAARLIEFFLNIFFYLPEHCNMSEDIQQSCLTVTINPYPTAFPYGNGMVLHFYQQQESSTTKTVHKVINKGLKTYV